MKTALTVALVLLSACGLLQPEPDFYVDGVGVKLETSAEWARAPDFAERFRATAAAGLEYSGGSYADLAGWVVVFKDGRVECSGTGGHNGCAEGYRQTITVSSLLFSDDDTPTRCVESTVLAHEVVHVTKADRCHEDPVWKDFRAVEEPLREACPLLHPSGSPEVAAYLWVTWPTCGS